MEAKDLTQKFSAIINDCIKTNEQFFGPIESNHSQIVHMYETWKNIIKKKVQIYKQIEEECHVIFTAACRAMGNLPDVETELTNRVLRCIMATGEMHVIQLRCVGTTLFLETSFDDGVKGFIESVGYFAPLVENAREVHITEILANGHKKSYLGAETDPQLYNNIIEKTEWFLMEVGKRVPIYRIAYKHKGQTGNNE